MLKNSQKFVKKPHSKPRNNESNVFSVTIRTGKGVNLGSNAHERLVSLIESFPQGTRYLFSLEKVDEGNACHYQGGIHFGETLVRQDKLREKFIRCFRDEKLEEKTLRHGFHIVSHNNWSILVNYIQKENAPFIRNLIPWCQCHKIGKECYYHGTIESRREMIMEKTRKKRNYLEDWYENNTEYYSEMSDIEKSEFISAKIII